MEHYYQKIPGYFNFNELYSKIVNNCPDGSHFVEVGCWEGKSSVYLGVEIMNSNKNIVLDCVDNWGYEKFDDDGNMIFNGDMIYNKFLSNIKPLSDIIKHHRLKSVDASKLYDDESLDFVYIDASHEYEDVKDDLIHWYPKIKKGGIIAGHDYNDYFSGVKLAVDEFFLNNNFTFTIESNSWSWIYKK